MDTQFVNFGSPGQGSSVAATQGDGDETMPVIVHLVLDEHAGLAGITSQLPGGPIIAKELQEFYTRAGFRLFSHAYSQYFNTHESLTSALNFDASGGSHRYLTKKNYGYAVGKNRYLQHMANLNYKINIYQSNYFDFCSSNPAKIQNCTIYKPENIDAYEIRNLPLTQRIRLLINMYYSSFAVIKIAKLLGGKLIRWSDRRGITLPRIDLWHGRMGPISTAPTFNKIIEDVANSKGGTAFFAHLLMPHYPYVYTPNCAVRSPSACCGQRKLSILTPTIRIRCANVRPRPLRPGQKRDAQAGPLVRRDDIKAKNAGERSSSSRTGRRSWLSL